MAGESCFHGDVGCFCITNFTHHDDVWILAQKRPQGSGKCQSSFFIDIDLVDSREMNFRGIFNRNDIDAGLVESV